MSAKGADMEVSGHSGVHTGWKEDTLERLETVQEEVVITG